MLTAPDDSTLRVALLSTSPKLPKGMLSVRPAATLRFPCAVTWLVTVKSVSRTRLLSVPALAVNANPALAVSVLPLPTMVPELPRSSPVNPTVLRLVVG